jgi:hypothetical protein
MIVQVSNRIKKMQKQVQHDLTSISINIFSGVTLNLFQGLFSK